MSGATFDRLVAGIDEVPFRATPVRLRTENMCQSPVPVDSGDGTVRKCGRPLWGGDGLVNVGDLSHEHAMCSFCFHQWMAFHSPYVAMKANPAAATISNEGLARLFITRGLDAKPLPEIGSDRPFDTFPAEWDPQSILYEDEPAGGDVGVTPDTIPDWMMGS